MTRARKRVHIPRQVLYILSYFDKIKDLLRDDQDSIFAEMQRCYPDCNGPMSATDLRCVRRDLIKPLHEELNLTEEEALVTEICINQVINSNAGIYMKGWLEDRF